MHDCSLIAPHLISEEKSQNIFSSRIFLPVFVCRSSSYIKINLQINILTNNILEQSTAKWKHSSGQCHYIAQWLSSVPILNQLLINQPIFSFSKYIRSTAVFPSGSHSFVFHPKFVYSTLLDCCKYYCGSLDIIFWW